VAHVRDWWKRGLEVRPCAADDEVELLALFREPHVRRFLLDDLVVDAAWVRTEIAASEARFAGGALGLWRARVDGALAGFAGFRPFFEPPVLQLLYGVATPFRGSGLARAMASHAIAAGFAAGLSQIRASVDPPNEASLRLLAALGFRELARDTHVHFALPR